MSKVVVLALAVLAAAALAIAPAARAGASSGSYCTGSAGTAWGDPVVERNLNGREIAWEPDGGCYSFDGGCWATGTLKFYGVGSNTCLVSSGGADGSRVELGACNATGVVWW
jgi:opacity protein-like surface antigen